MIDKWTRKYMKLAKTLADDNTACYSRKIGCVLISEDNEPISFGYNGSIVKSPHNDDPAYLAHIWKSILTNDQRDYLIRKYDLKGNKDYPLYHFFSNNRLLITEVDGMGYAFVNKFSGCKTCPRKLLDIPSGESMDICNCLSYDTKILVENMKWMNIGQIVCSKKEINVYSYNEKTRKIELKPVVNWFKIKYAGEYYRIKTKYSRFNKHSNFGGLFTPDHEILTKSGWKAIESISHGDKIASREYNLNYIENQVVLGSLLGDSSISKTNRHSCRFRCVHSSSQKDYISFKHFLLERIIPSGIKDIRKIVKFPNGKEFDAKHLSIQSRTNRIFSELRELCYPNNKKDISKEWLDQLDELGLCFFYLDDGSLYSNSNAVFCMHAFSDKSKQLFISYLYCRFGILSKMAKDGNRLYIDSKNTKKFHKLICEFVPISMQYKIVPSLRTGKEPNIEIGELGELYYDEVIEIEKVFNKTRDRYKYCYCIEVEDNHNFITANEISKNCSHAERNAIFNAAKGGISAMGGHMYCFCGVPCHECAIAVIQSKIASVTCLKSDLPDYSKSSRGLFQMAGVNLHIIDEKDIFNE